MLYDMDYTDPENIRPLFFRGPSKTGSERPGPEQRGGAGMILQALTEYYQALEREGKIDAPGWIKGEGVLCSLSGSGRTLEQSTLCRQNSQGVKNGSLHPRVFHSLPL